ncbi:MAG: DUF4082 domain-containing protein [bacterium]
MFICLNFLIPLSIARAQEIPEHGYYYAIVTPSPWTTACEQLRQLRSYDPDHQAIIITLDEIPAAIPGNPTYRELKNYFQDRLYPAPPSGYGTKYMLLVGDSEYIPAYAYTSALSYFSDSEYTNFFSNGSEIAIGRISVNNPQEISNYYSKIAPAGSSGNIIPDGADKPLIYAEGEIFLKNIWEPYLTTDEWQEGGNPPDIAELQDNISNHSISINTGHGYGPGLMPRCPSNYPTTITPFYYAHGCGSVNFLLGPPLYQDEYAPEQFINNPSTYSTIIGAVRDHSQATFGLTFFEAYFQYGYERIGDMLKLAQKQRGATDLMILLGDPYLKIVSNQFSLKPRIFFIADTTSGNTRSYNLDQGSGVIEPITFSLNSFNNCQWSIDNINYSSPLLPTHFSFSQTSGNSNATITGNFQDVNTLPLGNHLITFDLVDESNNGLVVKNITINLNVTNDNILDETDLIISGNEKILPAGDYKLVQDIVIESGKTLVVEPGTTLATDYDVYPTPRIIIQAGARITANGNVERPIWFTYKPPVWGKAIKIEIHGDGTTDYVDEFNYCLFEDQIIGVNNPKLRFTNCTFKYISDPDGLFPQPITGIIKNSIISRGGHGNPAPVGYLSDLKVAYSLVPRDCGVNGEDIIWDDEIVDMNDQISLAATSFCINAGDPDDLPDPDGTRKDMGAIYHSLSNAIHVPQDYPTIQEALNTAQTSGNKIVIVASGTYQENITIPNGVRLMGGSETNRPVLQGLTDGTTLIEHECWGTNLIENFIITKQGEDKTGRALSITDTQLFALRNVDFINCQDNEALIFSSGMNSTLYLSKVNFINNINNHALIHIEKGGGNLNDWIKDSIFENNFDNDYLVYFERENFYRDFLFSNILFKNNLRTTLISCKSQNPPPSLLYTISLEKGVFFDNDAVSFETGSYGAMLIRSSTFFNNCLSTPFQVLMNENSTLDISNSILWDSNLVFNKAETATFSINYTDSNSPYPNPGNGDINLDPLFTNAEAKNLSLSASSPCLDAGDPLSPVPKNGGSRIDMGAYEYFQDTTPPSTPIVRDEGDYTQDNNSLSVFWYSEDLELKVTEYIYQVREGFPTDGNIIRDWTLTSQSDIIITGLSLETDKTYFIGVRAKNEQGLWSEIGYSDGITVQPPVNQPPVINVEPSITPNPLDENIQATLSVAAFDPDGDNLTYTWEVSDGTIQGSGNTVSYLPPDVAVESIFTINLLISDAGGQAVNRSLTITVQPVDQTPWQTNANGTLYINKNYNYTMGYHFTPNHDGQITKLGGFFNGTKAVFLWDKNTGHLLAQASVTSANNWSYTDITPVSVQAGRPYTVAVYLAGSGGSYRNAIISLPQVYKNITIEAATFVPGEARPVNSLIPGMYGQVDINFIPIGGLNYPPVITSMPTTQAYIEQQYQYEVKTVDVDNGDVMAYSLEKAPAGMSIDFNLGIITWTPTTAQLGTHPLTLRVTDLSGESDTQCFNLTVLAASSPFDQTPWQTNANGTLYTNAPWDYTMGYHFTPTKSGQITKLGGFFNGAKTVYLWNKSTGELLSQANVTSTNNWGYMDITPVSVQAGQTYTIAVYLAGSGGSCRYGITSFPRTYGDITIDGSAYCSNSGRPTNNDLDYMYGQVDINFTSN